MESEVARLPDELVESIMRDAVGVVNSAARLVGIDGNVLTVAREALESANFIHTTKHIDFQGSIVAVDGGRIASRLDNMDLLLVQAVGVEGIGVDSTVGWGENQPQYVSWSSALPHGEINESLSRGIMTLAEMIVLSEAQHDICILDGSHLTSVVALAHLFGANHENAEGQYTEALQGFLGKYNKSIGDIPIIVKSIFEKDNIIASTKYNSSRVISNLFLKDLKFEVDDKSLLTQLLKEGEYTSPQHLGLGERGDELFARTRVNFNLHYHGVSKEDFEWYMNEAIAPIKTRDIHSNPKESDIFFTYFRPYQSGPVYKIEVKRSLATNKERLETLLSAIKGQVVYPNMVEPYPQYVADIMAKSISKGVSALKEAIALADITGSEDQHLALIKSYRS